jgi:hypothetical protein
MDKIFSRSPQHQLTIAKYHITIRAKSTSRRWCSLLDLDAFVDQVIKRDGLLGDLILLSLVQMM